MPITFENIVGLITVVFWGIYVTYTIRTFNEIQRQTNLQIAAFMVVSAMNRTLGSRKPPDEAENLHIKWKEILTRHAPNAVRTVPNLSFTLSNEGRSLIVSWVILVSVEIKPGAYLDNNYNTTGESCKWEIRSGGAKDNISPGKSVNVPIAFLGAFPEAKFVWSIKYTDLRKTEYNEFAGDRNYEEKNLLAHHPPPYDGYAPDDDLPF